MPSEVLLDAIEACGSTPEEFFFEDIMKYKEAKDLLKLYFAVSDEDKLKIKNLLFSLN